MYLYCMYVKNCFNLYFSDLFQVFELLWRLSTHDIWFTWERLEYLMHTNDKILCEIPYEVSSVIFRNQIIV